MAYVPYQWKTGEPITQGRMRTIEQGIADAHTKMAEIDSLDTRLDAVDGGTAFNENGLTLSQKVAQVDNKAGNAYSEAVQARQETELGKNAWDQVSGAITIDPVTNEITKNLATRLSEDESNITSITGNFNSFYTGELVPARGALVHTGNGVAAQNLKQKLDDMDAQINLNKGNITTSQTDYAQAKITADGTSYNTLQLRLNAADTIVAGIKAELEEAHGSTYNDIDDRFVADETRIGNLERDKVAINDIVDNLNQTDTNKPLSANQGNVLSRTLGSGFDTNTNTVSAVISRAQTNAENNAEAYTDGLLGSGFDTTNTVAQAIADLASDTTDAANALDGRLDDVEEELSDAHTSSVIKETIIEEEGGEQVERLVNKTYDSIDARLEAIENHAAAVRSDVNTIAGELAMVDGTSIVDTNTRVDTLENDLRTMAAELDMLDGTAIVDTNTRIDGITDEINAAHRTDLVDEHDIPIQDNLDKRFSDIESRATSLEETIDDASTGLAATKAIADQALTKANNAATATTVGELTTRVVALEGKDTVIVNDALFNEGVPQIQDPSTNCDYLIKNNDDNKYYYWRYFGQETGWQLISGAGGGGTGSSSGEFAASLESITNPDENTDYFVGNNTIGYTHYRYIPSIDENVDGTFVRILPNGLIINAGVTNNGGLEAYTIENANDNIFSDFVAFKDVEATPVKDENEQVVATDLVFTNTNGQTVTARVQGGGGGGAVSSYTMRLNNTLTSLKLTVPKKDGYIAYVKSKVVVKDAGVIDETFDQSHTINVAVQYSNSKNGPWTNFTTLTASNNTEFSVDVTRILSLGQTTYVRVEASTLIDEETKTSSLIYEVTQVEMSIAAINFNQATVRTTNFNFQYRCMGSGLTKQLHFLIDGVDIAGSPITTTLHNDIGQQNIPIVGLAAGMHSFTVYFTVDGIESNVLNYYIIYNNDNTRQAPIIALAAENSTITYGDDLKINYTVATVGTETTDSVYLELYTMEEGNKVVYASQTFVDVENEQVKDWRPVEYPESGTAYIKAIATHTVNNTDYTDTKTIEITINELELPDGYTLEPAGEANLVYSYNAYGRTNNDAGKEIYHYNYEALTGETIQWTGNFNGFNWSGDGYKDGALIISGGATHTVDVPIFQNMYNDITLENSEGVTNISKLGRTVEIEYEVASATDLNDVIINYMDNISTTTTNGITQKSGVGFQVTPQSCYLLKSGSTVNTDSTGFIINESDIAAAYLTPGMRIHLAFVIEPWADTLAYDQSYHQSVNIYVNGEFANACPYTQGIDSFASSATLRIGSSSCIIKLYQIKMYNRGLTHKEILQNYKVAPAATRDKLTRLYDNDILNRDGYVDYEKARTKYTCLLLTGPAPIEQDGVVINPTVSPYKGYPSPAGRKDKKTGEAVGKTESGVTLTKANPNKTEGYDVEFDLRDKVPTDQSIEVPGYIGARGAYVSSNNVQGTSSQKYPVHNLKVYLAKWQGPKTTTKEVAIEEGEDTTGLEIVEHDGVQYKVITETTPAEIKKVKYSLKGKDEHGEDIGVAESTLCWKADYMSTDHANTYNANIADGLFSDVLPGASWGSKHQNTVYGIRCLLFQKQGDAAPEFLGDGCLNNDKGNNKTYDLERSGDDDPGPDTASQKWEFTNNSDDLGYFKTDTIFKPIGDENGETHIQALDAFESTYPDQGDLEDAGLEPNYNHLQIVSTWLSKRANYWDASTTAGTGGEYNDTSYSTERELKKAIFKREFTNHFNMNHALTYYIFSEYIALCDNRVKNMFLRSDNVRSEIIKNRNGDTILEGNNEPSALWNNYVNTSTGITDENYIDWENSTFAIWAPVLYDLDSCFGVENVGYIRVRYDATWDYTWNGAPQFNGYESRLWLQFADSFDTEIRATAPSLYNRSDGLNYSNFYRQQVVDNLNNISPALSNQDMLIKFDKPWSEGFMNYGNVPPSYETPYYKYLQRGSRTAQKTAFINMRSKLLASKYGAQEFTNDAIKFRTGVPVGASGNIIGYENAAHEMVPTQDEQHTIPVYGNGDLTETKITVRSNQTLYPGVAYGDNKPATRALTNGGKINAGESCNIYATSAVQGNDGVFICGASALTDIGDISKFRPYQIDVGAGINLKRLIVGSNAQGYVNNNTDTFSNLYKCVLLEEINVQNCSNVATLDLSNNPLIKKVYAAGSGATTVIFPNGGVLDTVEYSAVTGNITILNQKNLTNFSYENSETNNYGALRKLWIENTPNIPIVEIINTAMGNLTAGVRLVGLDINLFENASTQEEQDEALEITTKFLNTLVSDLAKGKYLDSTGAFTPGNTSYPYITGKVRVTSIRNSLLTKLNQLYPNLIVYNTIDGNGAIGNNIITEYTIEYRNYDGTLLYTDYRTGREHFIDPASSNELDIDPITGKNRLWSICPPDGIPKKPEDEQYKYTFGTYENGEYVRYSGWVKQYTTTNPVDDDYPQGNTVFIAYYPTTKIQRYTVNWYEEPTGAAILSYTENYGVDISGYTQPEERGAVQRVKIVDNVVKVFKGWDRPIGKLTGNTNIYALWETSTIDNGVQLSDIVMEELNAADLAAIARLGPEAKQRILDDKLGNSPIMVQMGCDFDYQYGVNTVDLLNGSNKIVFNSSTAEARIYDGQHGIGEVRPLAVNSDWTLAIDYKFLLTHALYNNGTEYVLASCYSNADSTIQGFKLALVKNNSATSAEQTIRLSWGTTTVTLDYLTIDTTVASTNDKQYSHSYRNMLVLRHKAAEPTNLYVYYTAPNVTITDVPYGSNISLATTYTTLTWANNNTINTPLILGGNYENDSIASPIIENNRNANKPAKGVIYWAKFWDKDLGEKNCNALAAWPHETVPFFLSGYDSNTTPTRQILENTNLSFVAAQAIGDRYAYPRRGDIPNTQNYVGWRESDARTICNSRIYKGMSMAYQSIILMSSVSATSVNITDNNDSRVQVTTTGDYFYLPAEREINIDEPTHNRKNGEVQPDWPSPWPWMKAPSIRNLYGFVSGSSTLELKSASGIEPFLYRFIGNYIKPTARIFNINVDPYNNGNTWTYNNNQISVQSGDVWINGEIAYIYYTNSEINEGMYVDIITAGGGWKKADIWHLRTYCTSVNFANENQFEKIEDNGRLIISMSNNYRRTEGRILCPEFSI